MKLSELTRKLKLKVLSGDKLLGREVSGGYSGDMLSDVLAHSAEGDIWITVQVHLNIVAVSAMKGHSAVLIVHGKTVDPETVKKAEEEKVVLLSTEMGSFEASAKVSSLIGKG